MDLREHLKRLPEPDATAPDRILQRFEQTRRRDRVVRLWPVIPVVLAAAAAALLVLQPWDRPREEQLDAADATETLHWSDQVQLEFSGHGSVSGTARDVAIDWEQGRLAVQVAPQTGTELAVHTEEAVVRVVGTAFTVTRDRLGVTVSVTHGTVSVDCTDGWTGLIQSETGDHTCLPERPALLLGRADALVDAGAPVDTQLHTLDLGLDRAEPDSAVASELRVRRMHARSQAGDAAGALADADAYLAGSQTGRTVEVQRFASRLALYTSCDRARPYLEALQAEGNAEDAVLLAECTDDPDAARALLERAVDELESAWLVRARTALKSLEGR